MADVKVVRWENLTAIYLDNIFIIKGEDGCSNEIKALESLYGEVQYFDAQKDTAIDLLGGSPPKSFKNVKIVKCKKEN